MTRTHALGLGGSMWYTSHLLTRQEDGMRQSDQSCTNCGRPLPDHTALQNNAPAMGPWGCGCPCGATYYTQDGGGRWQDEPHMVKPERDGYPASEAPWIDEATSDDPQQQDDEMMEIDDSADDMWVCVCGTKVQQADRDLACPECEPEKVLPGDLAGALDHHFSREPDAHYATDLEGGRPVYDVRLPAATLRFGVTESEGEQFVQFRVICQNHVGGWRGKGWRLRHDLRAVCEAAEERIREVVGASW